MVQIRDEVRIQIEIETLTLPDLGERLGIPITVRPWWGSRRQPSQLRTVKEEEVRVRARWTCPSDGYSTRIKWPEIQRGRVVVWEGPCHDHYGKRWHNHRQTLEVTAISQGALLLRVRASVGLGSHFLIGMDDARPYVMPVPLKVTTVQDAFEWLVPKPVREAIAAGLDVKRQGDWYFIPYDARLPRVERWWTYGQLADKRFPWPRTGDGLRKLLRQLVSSKQLVDPQQNLLRYVQHMSAGQLHLYPFENVVFTHAPLIAGHVVTRHMVTEVIPRSYPWPLVRGRVTAPNHPPLKLRDWHIAVRNRSTPTRNMAPGAGMGD